MKIYPISSRTVIGSPEVPKSENSGTTRQDGDRDSNPLVKVYVKIDLVALRIRGNRFDGRVPDGHSGNAGE